MYEITMPKLSDSMEVGQIIAWRVKEGDEVREGDVLAEVESDKAVMELECFHDGTIAEIRHGDGSEIAVGEVIGLIAGKGEKAAPPRAEPEVAAAVKEAPKAEAKQKPAAKAEAPGTPEKAAPAETGRAAISPYARRLAREKKIDVSTLTGTGPGGRIIARDVEAAAAGEKPSEADVTAQPKPEAPTPKPPTVAPSPDEELPEIDVRPGEATVEQASFRLRTIARRVTASKHVIPHFYITRAADVTELIARRGELKEARGMTVTHLVELASIVAIGKHPQVNRSYDRGRIIHWTGIHLGLAVDTEQGLTVAVLRDAQELSAKELVQRTTALVARAREGKLSGEERRHPTFTISNLGMFGVEHFEPIINPPSSMTLAVSSALEVPVVRDGKVEVGCEMKLTLSCDHRIIDGVQAAKFLGDLAALLEHPDELLGEAE